MTWGVALLAIGIGLLWAVILDVLKGKRRKGK